MRALLWVAEAIGDRLAIYGHVEAESPQAALALDERIQTKAAHLVQHPHAGKPGRVPGTREWLVAPSHVMVDDLTDDAVRVLRVLHTARQWPPESG